MSEKYGKRKQVMYPDIENWYITIDHSEPNSWNEALPVRNTESNTDAILQELQRLEAQLATAHAAREAAEAELERVTKIGVTKFHKAITPYIAGGSEYTGDNGLIRAITELGEHDKKSAKKVVELTVERKALQAKLEAAEAKLATLTNALTSMVLGADSDTPIGEIQDRIRVWLEDKEALQAENARLVAGVLRCPKCSKWEQVEFFEGLGYCCHDCKININISIAPPTPPATESARYGVTTSLGAPAVIRYSDNRIIRRFGAKGETLEQAKEYADELNANESEPQARQPIQSWNFEVGIRDVLEAYDGKQLAGDEGLSIVESKYNVNQMRDDIEHFTASYYDKWHYARSAGYLTTDKRPQLTQDGLDLLRSMQERDNLNSTNES